MIDLHVRGERIARLDVFGAWLTPAQIGPRSNRLEAGFFS
jgi:hypothetical protein